MNRANMAKQIAESPSGRKKMMRGTRLDKLKQSQPVKVSRGSRRRYNPVEPKMPRYKEGGMTCGGKAKKGYKSGGKVRGAGMCKKGVRPAKMY